MDDDIQIAGRPTLRARLSFTLNTQPGTGLHTGRNLNFHLLFALAPPCAPAFLTRMLHDATSTTTGLTGSRYRKESLLITDLARATTVGAVFRLRAVRRAVSLTLFASFKTRDTQLRSHSVVRIFERNLKVITQIGAALRDRATGASATATKDVVETKKIPEDIFDG